MTGVEITLVMIIAVLLVLLVLSFLRNERLYQNGAKMAVRDHTGCVASVIMAVSSEHEALILRQAAEAIDSAQGQHGLRVLGRKWVAGGPSVPAMWLNSCAENAEGRNRG